MKNIFVLLPDGVGIRNFVFTKFKQVGLDVGVNTIYWNNTDFDLSANGLDEVRIKNSKSSPITDIYKRAKIIIELKQNYKKTKNKIYLSYIFPKSYKGLKNIIKSLAVDVLILFFNSNKGLNFIKKRMFKFERKTLYYKTSKETLKKENPSLVFLTNQRPITAIAPILAAQDLNIPTVTFIFSWDNLPKGMMVVESDYYFVWSEHMKEELMFYYPEIKNDKIVVTGSPQFEIHYDSNLIIPREKFYKKYKLDVNRRYICFSGDDITTSPNDEYYLEDVAQAVKELNKKGENIGVIYRKCPVDFTERHKKIYKKYKEVITLIDPLWDNLGNSWNRVMPNRKDMELLANTVFYTDLVINIGSSMVFDFAAQNKPCAYLNYNTEKNNNSKGDINNIYKFIHVQSMPTKEAVLWINSKNEIANIIKEGLNNKNTKDRLSWYLKICGDQPNHSSRNIWNEIKVLIK